MWFCDAKVWGSHCARPSFQKKAGPQGACNKMYKSLESTCLHYPESSRPWFPGQTPPSAILRRWLLLFVWPLAAAVKEVQWVACMTQSIPKEHQKCCQPWWGLWCSGSLPRSTEVSRGKQGGAVPWLTVLLWVTEMLSYWCWTEE